MSIPNKNDISVLANFDLFRGLSIELLNSALGGGTLKTLKHREFLYRAGEDAKSFCIVFNGALKLIRPSPRGVDIIVHFALQGDLIGALLMNQSEGSQFPISAKAMGPTKVVCIPRSTFQNIWKSNIELQNRMNTILYRRMATIQDDKTLFSSPLRSLIAVLLLRHLDQDDDGGTLKSLVLPLTRQEIADSLGVAVESVIRIMSDWTSEGLLHRMDDGGPEQVNVAKLIEYIEN